MRSTFIRCVFILFLFSQNINYCFAQTIPFGLSSDSTIIDEVSYGFSGDSTIVYSYYKPLSYDSITSPILFAIHGTGGTGAGTISHLIDIAERRHALIVAPNMQSSGCIREGEAVYTYLDQFDAAINNMCSPLGPATVFFKRIYRHVLDRESRILIPSYMIGFSVGGQFVTRYMLIRQAYPDSIPLKMAVSTSAYYYTFPTDTFSNIAMPWLCGFIPPYNPLAGYCPESWNLYNFFCNEDVIQYYNENYGVLVGSADLQQMNDAPCAMIQGNNRYERAHTFYDFCDSNATNRGLTLLWQHGDVPGIGHDEYGLYNTKASPTDSSTIAETMLFDTPFHSVPSVAPVVGFFADTTFININDSVHFTNTSYNTSNYLWDFGDSTTSTQINPAHAYSTAGTYTIQLTAGNSNGCNTWNEKRHYIIVQGTQAIKTIFKDGLSLKLVPNPAHEECAINFKNINGNKNITVELLNSTGEKISKLFENVIYQNQNNQYNLNLNNLPEGLYLVKVSSESNFITSKLIVY